MFQKKPTVGIDISDYSVEILQLEKSRKVSAYRRIILEAGIVGDGQVLEKKILAEKIKDALKTIGPGHFKAILSLPESKVFIHRVALAPELAGKELERRILEEVRKIMPMDMEDFFWDYFSLPGEGCQDVVYVGAAKETVEEYLEIMRLAGIEPVAMDIDSISLSRALLDPQAGISMIADIGARKSTISVFDQSGLLNLSVTVPQGGNYLTESIAEKRKIALEAAEKIKRSFGLGKRAGVKALAALEGSLEPIIGEISRAISHYEGRKKGEIKEIILAGGTALLPGLDKYIAQATGKKVSIGNPLEKVKGERLFDKEHPAILFANVIGLALRGFAGDLETGINLMHRSPGTKKDSSRNLRPAGLKKIEDSLLKKEMRYFAFLFLAASLALSILLVYRSYFPMKITVAPEPAVPAVEPPANEEARENPLAGYGYGQVGMPDMPIPEAAASAENSGAPVVPEGISPGTGDEIPAGASGSTVENGGEASAAAPAAERTVTVRIKNTPTGWLNVRSGPSTKYAQVERIHPNEEYEFLKEENGWYKIKINDNIKEGWIDSTYAEIIN